MPRKTPLTDEQRTARAAYQREYRRRHPDRIKEHDKRSREKHAEQVHARQKKWREANEDHIREKGKQRYLAKKDHVADLAMQRKFGITLAQYTERLESQNRGCAICDITESRKGNVIVRFSIDHDRSCCPGDHSCGQCVRGLLCTHCNVGIGHLRDDVSLLESAISYLKEHRENAAQQENVGLHQQ